MVTNSVAQMAQTSNCAKANPGCVFPCFVGYKWLEDFARCIDPDRLVYMQPLKEPATDGGDAGPSGLRHNTSMFTRELLTVVCAQHDRSGCVHVCRLVADELVTLDGIPCGPNEEIAQRLACAHSLFLQVSGWLSGLDLEVIEGSYAMPEGLRLREGRFGGVRFEKERRRWALAPDFVMEYSGHTEGD